MVVSKPLNGTTGTTGATGATALMDQNRRFTVAGVGGATTTN